MFEWRFEYQKNDTHIAKRIPDPMGHSAATWASSTQHPGCCDSLSFVQESFQHSNPPKITTNPFRLIPTMPTPPAPSSLAWTSTPPGKGFHIGVELELLLGGPIQRTWDETAATLATILCASGIQTLILPDDSKEVLTTWAIVTDVTVKPDPGEEDEFGLNISAIPRQREDAPKSDLLNTQESNLVVDAIELVSPCMDGAGDWNLEIILVFSVLKKAGYEVEVNHTCGFHVLISHGKDRAWGFPDAKSLCRLFLLVEKDLDQSVGQGRLFNEWCESNRMSLSKLQGLSLVKALDSIAAAKHRQELVKLMCTKQNGEFERYFKLNIT